MFFQPAASRCGFTFTHEHGEAGFGSGLIEFTQCHRQEASGVRIHRGLPQLSGIHLAQAFEARNTPDAFFDAVFAQFVFNCGELTLVEGIDFLCRFFATRRRINAV